MTRLPTVYFAANKITHASSYVNKKKNNTNCPVEASQDDNIHNKIKHMISPATYDYVRSNLPCFPMFFAISIHQLIIAYKDRLQAINRLPIITPFSCQKYIPT